jgi:parvulin-like peptidyl-prolyl isomerase
MRCSARLLAALSGAAVVLAGQPAGSLPRAAAQAERQTAVREEAAPAPAPAQSTSDNAHRWAAVIYGNEPITREELGNYLIARYPDKVELLVNKRIMEHACRQQGIEVSAAEVNASIAEDLKGMGNIPLKDFVKTVLTRYGKTLYEWKEDVVRPKMMMTKLCRGQVQITEDDYQAAFQARYGEKFDGRIIFFAKGERAKAEQCFTKIRDSEEEFDRMARQQADPRLAGKGGHIDPFARHATKHEMLETEAFNLKPGEMTRLIATEEGYYYIRCDRRIPADTSKTLTVEKPALEKELVDKKVNEIIGTVFKQLQKEAQPKLFLKRDAPDEEARGGAAAGQGSADNAQRWVAQIYGKEPITREEYADFLIARHAEQLELLVNKRIIEHVCKEKGIEVTRAEVEAALAQELKAMGNLSVDDFEKKVLSGYHKTLYEWKEDVIRPKLLMTKVCRGRVQPTQQDFEDAFQAHYGEKFKGRLILFPQEEKNHALSLYGKIRDSEAEFDRLASQQASPTLARRKGEVDPFARHTTGNEELEKEAFNLHPGEVSRLIGTPQGCVYLKCDARLPADSSKKLEQEKPNLEKEIVDKKIELEMTKVFKEFQDSAAPKLYLKKYTTEEELVRDVERELKAGPTDLHGPPHRALRN